MALKVTEAQGEDTQTEVRQVASRERDETQKWLDEQFKTRLEAWRKHGKPNATKGATNREVTHRLTVAKTDVAALKAMVRRAATLHKSSVLFYKDAKDGAGNTTVKYIPADPAPKKNGNGQTA